MPCNARAVQCELQTSYPAAFIQAVGSNSDQETEGNDVSSLGEWKSDMAGDTTKRDVSNKLPSDAEMGVGWYLGVGSR